MATDSIGHRPSRTALLAISIIGVVAAVVLIGRYFSGEPATNTAQAESSSQEVQVQVEGLLKPSSELTITADCGTDTHAQAEASFGGSATLSPAADAGVLIGDITAPTNIGPGPDNGYHTVTVTCESGAHGSVTLEDSGNGTAKTRSESQR